MINNITENSALVPSASSNRTVGTEEYAGGGWRR